MDKVLLDTSVWITFFRAKNREVVQEVGSLLTTNRVLIAGVVLLELLQGALNEKEMEKILTLMEPVSRIDPSSRTWEEAGRLSYSIRKKGFTISTVDALIAALAIENDALLFTEDKHFDWMNQHTDLRLYSSKQTS
ncbi:MAG: PIN domain-containing protein [Deltaproteobacteria bacterium]|nr:PIN domain-containing protein [Deltaproteobacteria bacterium]